MRNMGGQGLCDGFHPLGMQIRETIATVWMEGRGKGMQQTFLWVWTDSCSLLVTISLFIELESQNLKGALF